ncbi:hypothetical protein DAPPUDRAFT_321059 [Daphnia pulex]|uniref:Uncharacterized protein n=1 Tax=Daphnia pulex TaxID=6669 RepID=E9GRT2_DAPPU|nr:hypothetical protein DAPPUDRAFT_321059 [Daphnia pulex]|eukprot:EFX77829.1 hypothetical protein DAPPUDRAFT_321059 [Daphnia pulex]
MDTYAVAVAGLQHHSYKNNLAVNINLLKVNLTRKRVTASSTSQTHIRRMRREANQNVEVWIGNCESFHDVDGDNVDDPNHVDFSLNDVNNRDLTLSESDPEPNEDFDYIDDSLIAIEIKEQH